jgi:hypothetical protein
VRTFLVIGLLFCVSLFGQPTLPDLTQSATGYIESPFVATQIRVRVDAAWDNRTPDRAEFFYAKCGCFESGGDPNAPGPSPGIATNLNFQEYTAAVEYAFTQRFSMFAEVPFRTIQPVSFTNSPPGSGIYPNQGGFSDFRPGFKYAVDPNPNRYITFQVRAYTPTGDAQKGLGTNHYSVEPSLLFQDTLTPRTKVSGQVALWIPIGGSSNQPVNNGQFSGDVLSYGLGISYDLSARHTGVRVTPVLEFVGWNVRSGSVTEPSGVIGDATNTNIANLKGGARVFFNRGDSVYIGYGRQLTHIGWYRDLLRIEYRHVF